MGSRIENFSIDSTTPRETAQFWAEALGWRIVVEDSDDDEVALQPHAGSPEAGALPDILFLRVPETKAVKNRLHLDLRPDDQAAEVARLEALGARRVDIGQGTDVTWVVMADPEGNEFCVLRTLTEAERAAQ
ncbi:VOC family protein [Arthrobacter glacialis]|uniref:Glyoxalase n=1 Tax=Arthrobacter glacialis TaxID=1664 RepID=A0A2S3ZSE1_ARTGL|nr:VOC family protein [Arthrobacter glacialis]POH56961.1 glyoxalase [Arthrobacter glacialis]POH72014.1 glyoxalase [Arthrobacter glacialis]